MHLVMCADTKKPLKAHVQNVLLYRLDLEVTCRILLDIPLRKRVWEVCIVLPAVCNTAIVKCLVGGFGT